MHRIIAVALVSAVFGGTVGAMATAAVESQASPSAIAAAVERVQDSAAERSLAAEAATLKSINQELTQPTIDGSTTTVLGQLLKLTNICNNTSGEGYDVACG